MKVLDVADLQVGLDQTLESLKRQQNEMSEVEAAIQGFIELEDSFKGKGGEAIRGFYKEVHVPFISYYRSFLEDYQSRIQVMKAELFNVEPAINGVIVEPFLTGELQHGLQHVADQTATLTDEANSIIFSVQDIVSVPHLNDSEFLQKVNIAKKHIHDIVDELNQFDYNQCIALEQLYDNVLNMQQYIKSIESLFQSGELQVANYKSGTLSQYKIDKLIKKEEIQENIEEKVETNSCSRAELEEIEKKRIEELQKQLGKVSSPDEYLKIANEIGLENLDPIQQQIVIELETAKQNAEMAKGIGKGLYDVGKDLVTGIYDFVTYPKETIESVVHAATHPKETYNYLSKAISDSYERDMVNGDAYSRAYWVTYAVGTVATSILGTKGIGSVTKTGMASTTATVKAGVDKTKTVIKETPFSRLLPYAPHHQMALAGVNHVPYNTVNSVGLRDQLIIKAQKISNSSRVPFTGKGVSVPWLSDKYNAVEIKGKVKAKGEIKDIDRRVYQIKNLDINRVDSETGKTNLQLMRKGRSPFADDGSIINLHHLIQEEPGAMLEIPESLHKKYSKILHGLKENGESFRNDPVLKAQYDNFRSRYWKWRAKQFEIENK
ncbi:T7SS effector LXG polymorphic toxin [Peribacillus asahii]|uniref:T7SS effector LXG polymorphic toxin n=1 Tax=Peribacillus asahii TaxID=228899 RepID=UPI00207A34D5|nr:T7SS effector LXG polymorphic toxin [Peribacillus asahii]USK68815.1 hypothetical protein LIS76_14680 [Peribacillus asahii]